MLLRGKSSSARISLWIVRLGPKDWHHCVALSLPFKLQAGPICKGYKVLTRSAKAFGGCQTVERIRLYHLEGVRF